MNSMGYTLMILQTNPLHRSTSTGKLEAMAVLLQKLRSERRRVLIFTQMPTMLDLLEAFLDHRHLPYVRVDESLTPEERQVRRRRPDSGSLDISLAPSRTQRQNPNRVQGRQSKTFTIL